MNHEYVPYPEHDHRPEQALPAACALVEKRLNATLTDDERAEIDRLVRIHRFAFDIYLDSIWNGAEPVKDMEADFLSLHVGAFDNVQQFVDSELDYLGWYLPIRIMMNEHGMPAEVLRWIREGYLASAQGYRFFTRGGEFHVFYG